MIFLTISLIYSLYLYDHNQKNLIIKYKFTISSFVFLLLTITIGFRDALGSDYGSYYLDFIYMNISYLDKEIFQTQKLDLVYEYLSFLTIFLNLQLDFLNLLIACIFIFSVVFFSNQEDDYLLIILAFLSYHYLVLGMGYIRQGLSISFLLFFIHFWRNEKNLLSWIFLILAIMSHKFAIVSSFLIFLRPKGNWFYFNKYFYLLSLFIISLIFFKIFESKNINDYFEVYSSEHSSGAIYRTLAGTICGILFFLKKSFFKKRLDYRYLYASSTVLILLFPASFFYSTISDRILAYFLPCMFIILCTIPNTFKNIRTSVIKFVLVSIFFSHLLIWSNFSSQSKLYVPYRMIDYPGAIESPYKEFIRYCC